tara:strand:+ start:3184 stop:3720 length:537 start_codon:yes stop_codon:yes gene_type:complete
MCQPAATGNEFYVHDEDLTCAGYTENSEKRFATELAILASLDKRPSEQPHSIDTTVPYQGGPNIHEDGDIILAMDHSPKTGSMENFGTGQREFQPRQEQPASANPQGFFSRNKGSLAGMAVGLAIGIPTALLLIFLTSAATSTAILVGSIVALACWGVGYHRDEDALNKELKATMTSR